MILSYEEMNKALTFLRYKLSKYGEIDERLRGWHWYEPPVEPPSTSLHLSVSEIAYRYCPTMRDIYLKRVERITPTPSIAMIEGKIYHEIIKYVTLLAKRLIYNEQVKAGADLFIELLEKGTNTITKILKELTQTSSMTDTNKEIAKIYNKAISLWKFISLQIASKYDAILSKYSKVNPDTIANLTTTYISERIIDGSRIGLSNRLSIDAVDPGNILIEIKTGREEYFHKLALAGYALALESESNLPVDFALLLYMHINTSPIPIVKAKPILIADEYRKEFLELRDKAMALIINEKDPGTPRKCHTSCPFFPYCRGISK